MAEGSLKGRTAWVTGGGTGMGKAIALALARCGADLAIGSLMESNRANVLQGQSVHLVSEQKMEAARAEIESLGVRAIALPLDIGANSSAEAFYRDAVAAYGKIDILVNAASASTRHPMIDHPDELWERILNADLTGAYRTTKLCLPGMFERRWGRIINIASTAANVGAVAHSAYCAAKACLLGLTRCVVLESASHGVSCNAINPASSPRPKNSIGMLQQMRIDGDEFGRLPADDSAGHSTEALDRGFGIRRSCCIPLRR